MQFWVEKELNRMERRSKDTPAILIMGLGNNFPAYQGTRHNVGFYVVDIMMQNLTAVFRRRLFSSVYYSDLPSSAGIRPLSFIRWSGAMNNSGRIAPFLRRYHSSSLENLYVIVDNMDLPPGKYRLKKGGSSAGHNGLKSLINTLGTGNFNRMYIGIGRPSSGESVVDHVLGKPNKEDELAISNACTQVANVMLQLRDIPLTKAVN